MAELRAELEAALQSTYAIERELGRGGMATVFLAQDLRHDRPVALKVLHPELGATLGPERFLREIRLCARLQHPHILTVLDSGEVTRQGGVPLLWFTMPYVEGESLRVRLTRERQLPVEDALRIARETADALDYAHRHGVVHRDIKPENILLSGDHALVADFGVARALGGGGERLTETGLAVGTPSYMSPEQASGERELDGRTDIYALGTVLYEMLAGEPPFSGPTAQAIVARVLTESPRPLGTTRQGLPSAVDAVIARAMARTPADRYGTAHQFAQALSEAERATHRPARPSSSEAARPQPTSSRRPVSLAGVLVLGFALGLGVLFAWRSTHKGAPTPEGARTIAVLPFENMGDTTDIYFADGMTDAVRGKLTGLPGFRVISRGSSIQYKESPKSPQEIGAELGTNYLLTGTVRWQKAASGSRVQVSPELIDVRDGTTRWQQPFDAALSDVFQMQADIAGRVAQALNVALGTEDRGRLAERPTANLAAYDAFLKGEEVSGGMTEANPPTLRIAALHYEQAVALDSTFALAWAQLSRARSRIYVNGVPTPELAEQARTAAERAVTLAPDRVEGRIALGFYYSAVNGDVRRELEEYAKARKRWPDHPDLLSATALAEMSTGRWQESVELLRRVVQSDPRSTSAHGRLARALLWVRRPAEALEISDRTLRLAPGDLITIEEKAMAHLSTGDLARARATIRNPAGVEPTVLAAYVATYWDLGWLLDDAQQQLVLRLTPASFDGDLGNRAIVYAQIHHYRGNLAASGAYADTARAAFEAQLKETPNDVQRHVLRAWALAYAGRTAEAIREGERWLLAGSPATSDGFSGPYYRHLLTRIYLLAGEKERALDQLESLLKIPYYLSPGWLSVDPTFDPLRGDPRFERLVKSEAVRF
jgi:serine/threonine-protein kinase